MSPLLRAPNSPADCVIAPNSILNAMTILADTRRTLAMCLVAFLPLVSGCAETWSDRGRTGDIDEGEAQR